VTTAKSCGKQQMTYLWLFHEGFYEFSISFPWLSVRRGNRMVTLLTY